MKDINSLSKTELNASRTLCRMLYRIVGIEYEPWLANAYGGQNQLESELSEIKTHVNNLIGEMNFGSKDSALNEFNKIIKKGTTKFPAISKLLEI